MQEQRVVPLYAAPCQRCNPPPPPPLLPGDSWERLQQENKNKLLFEPQIQRKLQFLLYSNINNLPKQRLKNIQQSSNALKDCHRKAEREKSREGIQPGVYTIKKLFIYYRGGAEQSCNVSIILLRGCSNKRLSKVTGRPPLIMPFGPHKVHMDICTHLLLYCRMYNHPEAFLCHTPSSLFPLAAGNKQ